MPIHKKNERRCLENHRPVSLLPICGKIVDRLIFNEIFPSFIKNGIILPIQSGFKSGDSCVNQHLSITHEIYKSFDGGFDVRIVFLDISKAFCKVWSEGIIFKLKQNDISGELSNLSWDFLRTRKQRLVLNGQFSMWTNVNARVRQGLILGPLFCLIYVNDLADELSSNTKSFADDTSLFSVLHRRDSSVAELNNYLAKISHWTQQWRTSCNPEPSKQAQEVIFSRKVNMASHPPLTFNNSIVFQATS